MVYPKCKFSKRLRVPKTVIFNSAQGFKFLSLVVVVLLFLTMQEECKVLWQQ